MRATDDPGKGVVSFDYDAEGRQTLRQPTGAPLETWSYYHDGLLRENKDPNGHLTSSTYDLDGNLRRSDDASGVGDPSQVPLEVTVRWSEFDEPLEGKQRRNDASAWRTTLSSFDANGNLDTRTDEAGSAQERVNDFEYDQADRLTWQRDNGAAGCADDQRIEQAYNASGWLTTRSIRKADAGCGADAAAWPLRQQEQTSYFGNGQAETLKTWKGPESAGNLVEQHTLAYESGGTYLDGNQASDSYLLKGPDATAPCFAAACTATYRYDGRSRLLESDNGVPSAHPAWQKTVYALDTDTAGVDLLVGNIATETTSGAGAASVLYPGRRVRPQSVAVQTRRRKPPV